MSEYDHTLVGLTLSPKTGELVAIWKTGSRQVTIRSLTGDRIGDGGFDSSWHSSWSAPMQATYMPRVHTPAGVAQKQSGYGTALYTGLCIASHQHFDGAIKFSGMPTDGDGEKLGDGICSGPNQMNADGTREIHHERDPSASAWWAAAANLFGLVERVYDEDTDTPRKRYTWKSELNEENKFGGIDIRPAFKKLAPGDFNNDFQPESLNITATGTYRTWIADVYPYHNAERANLVIGLMSSPVSVREGDSTHIADLDFDEVARRLQLYSLDGRPAHPLIARANFGLLAAAGASGKRAMEFVLKLARRLDVDREEIERMKFRYLGGIGIQFSYLGAEDPTLKAGFQPSLGFQGRGITPTFRGLMSREQFLRRYDPYNLYGTPETVSQDGKRFSIASRSAWTALFDSDPATRAAALRTAFSGKFDSTPQGKAFWKQEQDALSRGQEMSPGAVEAIIDWIYKIDLELQRRYQRHEREHAPPAAPLPPGSGDPLLEWLETFDVNDDMFNSRVEIKVRGRTFRVRPGQLLVALQRQSSPEIAAHGIEMATVWEATPDGAHFWDAATRRMLNEGRLTGEERATLVEYMVATMAVLGHFPPAAAQTGSTSSAERVGPDGPNGWLYNLEDPVSMSDRVTITSAGHTFDVKPAWLLYALTQTGFEAARGLANGLVEWGDTPQPWSFWRDAHWRLQDQEGLSPSERLWVEKYAILGLNKLGISAPAPATAAPAAAGTDDVGPRGRNGWLYSISPTKFDPDDDVATITVGGNTFWARPYMLLRALRETGSGVAQFLSTGLDWTTAIQTRWLPVLTRIDLGQPISPADRAELEEYTRLAVATFGFTGPESSDSPEREVTGSLGSLGWVYSVDPFTQGLNSQTAIQVSGKSFSVIPRNLLLVLRGEDDPQTLAESVDRGIIYWLDTPQGRDYWADVKRSIQGGHDLEDEPRAHLERFVAAAIESLGLRPATPNPAEPTYEIVLYGAKPNASGKVKTEVYEEAERLAQEWKELGWDRFAADES